MKATFIKILAMLALSVIATGARAQCPTLHGLSAYSSGTGTAVVTAMMTPSTTASPFYWTVSPSTGVAAGTHMVQENFTFYAPGVYTICATYMDSTTMCSATACTTVNITSATSTSCNAAFSYYTDSTSCQTHFTNASTGSNLSYRWYRIPSFTLLSTQQNPVLSLGNGGQHIALYTYSNGQFCDSATAFFNVNCTPASCHASFTYSAQPNCDTYFYSTSTGSNLSYEWRNMSQPMFPIISTQNTFTTTLPGSSLIALYVYSNGQFCDSITRQVSCGSGTMSCHASYSAYTDSSCTTHFVNSSTGSATSMWWRINNVTYTSNNVNVNLPNGTYPVILYNLYNGAPCDSVLNTVTVACGSGSTSCQANSQFTVFADSVNAGNYFAYNQSTGTGALSYLWDFGDGSTSTQQYPFHQYATPGSYVICLTVTAGSGSVTCSDMSCDSSSVRRIAAGYLMSRLQVLPQGATSVDEQRNVKTLSVYPNPVDQELTIAVELLKEEPLYYSITDALGKTVVANQPLNGPVTHINTAALDRGIYFLSISSDKQRVKTTRIVK